MAMARMRSFVAELAAAFLGDVTENVAMLDFLLRAGLAVDGRDANGDTLLHRAARTGRVAVVEVLIKHGADVQVMASDGARPLHCAAEGGSARVVELLLKSGMQRDRYKNTPLHHATTRAVVTELLKAGADVEAEGHDGHRPLHCAVYNSGVDIGVVESLIRAGADANAAGAKWGETPLHVAAAGSSVAKVRALVQAGANVEATAECKTRQEEWSYQLARAGGDERAARAGFYISSGPLPGAYTPFVDGGAPLHVAALRGSSEVLASLLDAGADVHATAFGGGTALHYAARVCAVAKINMLLQAGAQLEAKDNDGLTPLHSAICALVPNGRVNNYRIAYAEPKPLAVREFEAALRSLRF